jgi:hypothetical protein
MRQKKRSPLITIFIFISLLLISCEALSTSPTLLQKNSQTNTKAIIPSLTSTKIPTPTPTAVLPKIICGRYENVIIGENSYIVQNDVYNDAATQPQCITVNPETGAFTIDRADNDINLGGAPASYPFIWKGCHWGLCTTDSGLPLQIEKINMARSSWSVTTISRGVWNAAFVIWVNSTPTTSTSVDGAGIMIWINSHDVSPYGHNNGIVSISGSTWELTNGMLDVPFIVYRSTSNHESVSDLDIKAFLDDSVTRGWIKNDWYLIALDAGFELWRGGAGMSSDAFSFSASGNP